MYRQIYFNELLLYTEKHKVVITEQLKKTPPKKPCNRLVVVQWIMEKSLEGSSANIREKGTASLKTTSLVNYW